MKRLALAILFASCWLTATCAVQSWKVRGNDDPYDAQAHQGAIAPAGDGCVIYDLERPCMPIPAGMQAGVRSVWLECEVKGWWSRWATPADAVSRTGDYGMSQLSRIHAPAMAGAGLDFWQEEDRIAYAISLWSRSGWAPWSCAH